MTDLSNPPLSLIPLDDTTEPMPLHAADLRVHDHAHEPFAWPTPPLTSYPAPRCPIEPEACVVEGLNGKALQGRLVLFDPDAGELRLQLAHSRAPMPLRFSQFRRLILAQPLAPLAGAAPDDEDGALTARPALPYHVVMRSGNGAVLDGLTVGHRSEDYGLFLFEPLDAAGHVRRVFVPRAAYRDAAVGERIGELLVAQQAAETAEVEAAAREQAVLRSKRLGEVLIGRQIVTPDQLEAALEHQARMPMVRIGEALQALGHISQDQLTDALAQQREDRSIPLGELLVRRGVITREDLHTALARKMGYPLVDVAQFPVEAEAVHRLPYSVAARLHALPLMVRSGRVVVAMEDPTESARLEELEFIAQAKVVPVLAHAGDIVDAIDRAYARTGLGGKGPAEMPFAFPEDDDDDEAPDVASLLATLEKQSAEQRNRQDDDRPIEQSDNSLVRLINTMIAEAQQQGVSDIHIECLPGREKVRIRFRKDGQLRPYMELPPTYRAALIARIKIMCDLDISERRKPQDGKINFARFQPGAKLELRVATIPTNGGMEDAVLRLLSSAKPMPIDAINLSAHNLARLSEAVQRPYGMVLCVGPTGSGKTTTLHSALGTINKPERKIWTAEDPIEITQAGLRQVQVNPKIGWTFAKALRAFLRADPDVIMVGEIRDEETAQVAIEASLTGHLVLSTLHTNNAPETVTRLLDMGMDPFNFADSLLAVLAQRLVRRLCKHCTEARPASAAQVDEWLDEYLAGFGAAAEDAPSREQLHAEWLQRFGRDGHLPHHEAPGCEHCDHTGLRGRTAIHELLIVSKAMRALIQGGGKTDVIQRLAIAEGMRTLRQDGIEKMLAGQTTLAEVRATSNG